MNQYWSAIQPVLVTPTYQYWSRREVVLVTMPTSTGCFFLLQCISIRCTAEGGLCMGRVGGGIVGEEQSNSRLRSFHY